MTSAFQAIQQFVERGVPPMLTDPDAVRRARLIVWVTIVLQSIALLLALTNVALRLNRLALLLAGFIALLGFVHVVLRRSATAAAHLLVGILWLTVVAAASMRGRAEAPALMWLALCPLMATLISGSGAGAFWVAMIAASAATMPWFYEHHRWLGPIEHAHITRPINIGTMAFAGYTFALIYERARDHTFRLLRDANQSLAALNEQVAMEHRVAEQIVSHLVQRGTEDPAYMRRCVSPSQVFNGDMILVARTPSGSLRWMLGDFTGHGLVAAIGTIPASTVFYDGAAAGLSLTETVVRMNRALHQLLPTGLFCASAVMELDVNGTLTVWNGGLPSALLVQNGEVVQRFESRQLALGIGDLSAADVVLQQATLQPDSRVVTFSDGVPETVDDRGAMLGVERAEQLLLTGVSDLAERLGAFRGSALQADDVSSIEVRYDAAFIADCGVAARTTS